MRSRYQIRFIEEYIHNTFIKTFFLFTAPLYERCCNWESKYVNEKQDFSIRYFEYCTRQISSIYKVTLQYKGTFCHEIFLVTGYA